MTKRNNRWVMGLLAIAVALGFLSYVYWSGGTRETAAPGDSPYHERTDGYYTVVDESSRTLFTTGLTVSVGDEYIDENDGHYIIERIEGDVASARLVGRMEALPVLPILSAAAQDGVVAIYHTHSDESYVPTDGHHSRPGGGGIIQVGSAMAEKLEESGVKAVHDSTLHDPHDAGAYDRSRRTATQLLKKKPLALFDVHRDAGPAEPYLKDVGNAEAAKCMIVVGRTNPKMSANLDFARRLRDAVNKKTPGLVKGIFMGNADFNQDLYERALLLEVGTEKTSREAAERGVELVASAVPGLLGATSGPEGVGKGTGKAIGWVLGLAVAGAFVYLWIATGSWDEMKAKILGWFGTGGVRIGGGRDDQEGPPDR
ncbi:MAG: stage II sporulation protein P [Bacillota bacterium]